MSSEGTSTKSLYRMACALAVVSGVFSLLVGILLFFNTVAVRMASPLNLPELDHLRASLKASPADDAVRDKIRDLDQIVRHLYFTGLASRRAGEYLLLVGVVLSLLSLKAVSVLSRRQPDPRAYPVTSNLLHAEAEARWALAGAGVVILAIGVYFAETTEGNSNAARVVPRPSKSPEALGQGGMGAIPVATWPAFRGASGCGAVACTNSSEVGGGATNLSILWKSDVPLPGMSSPVVWGNKVYLTGASEEKREVYCYDIDSGTRLWSVAAKGIASQVKKAPEIFKDTGYAAPTSVTDGLRVYSIFANGDVIAVDPCSTVLWTVDLGLPVNRYGHSSSLAWCQDKVLIQYDQDSEKGRQSRLIALDSATGKELWSTPRSVSDSWPSPVVVETGKGTQLITVANDWIMAYEPGSGRELWKVKCRGTDVAPSPIFSGGLVLASITGDRIYAIRPGGTGDVTATHVAWTSEDGVTDVPSPVSNGELAFFVNSGGLMTCLDVKTGKKVWDQNLEGEFYGSPTLVGDRLYLVARNGTVFILRAGRKYEEMGKFALGEPSDGSPVYLDGRIIIRGMKTLFCLGSKTR